MKLKSKGRARLTLVLEKQELRTILDAMELAYEVAAERGSAALCDRIAEFEGRLELQFEATEGPPEEPED